ncbi:MAG TPA: N-succinylarginine dihydrolase [Myxococcota bacterium]|nr:N-succinylarginine dihydrolase [Myxococcota bacterium]
MELSVTEVNFDCLVGPTHNFAGLSLGNLASKKNQRTLSNPKKAALQGLRKMHYLAKRGFVQGVLPPHERPHLKSFWNLGFSGNEETMFSKAHALMPDVFLSLCSSSFMWAANCATISPSADSGDHRVHISPSNLITMFHRSIEHEFSGRVLKHIFAHEEHFLVHNALLPHVVLSDEGAANHNRLCRSHGQKGLQIFVYGKDGALSSQKTTVFPARQSRLANHALAVRHKLDADYFMNIEQNPLAIDRGAFHNDVVAVVNENVLLCHEWAFLQQASALNTINERFNQLFGEDPCIIEISNAELPIDQAITSYLFNSQLLTKPDGKMLLFAPHECLAMEKAQAAIVRLLHGDNPINEVHYMDVSESMANGGGPACLRLRILLSDQELPHIKSSVLLTDSLYQELEQIIQQYYLEELTLDHFLDKKFLDQNKHALDKIAHALGLDGVYHF